MTQVDESLTGLLAVQLWATLDAFEVRLTAELEPLGLTIAGFRLVGEVMREPDGIRQSELARRLRVRPPTVSAAVSRLEQGGLVERKQDPDDPRAWRVCLADGAPLQTGAELLFRLDKQLTRGMNDDDKQHLSRLLNQALTNLSRQTEDKDER